MKKTRQFYIPSIARQILKEDSTGIEVYYYETTNGSPVAIIFAGKSAKPRYHYRFSDNDRRDARVSEIVNGIRVALVNHEEKKIARREARKQPHSLNVGDIMVCSWGYEQTNIDFYQVTNLIGKTMVELRQIHSSIIKSHGTYDSVVPVKDSFHTPRFDGDTYKTKVLRKKVNPSSNSVGVYEFANAYKWDGRPETQTAFGYGH